MKLWRMSEREIKDYEEYCISCGNVHALTEINEFKKWYGKNVELIKGKKYPIGTKGKVFYVEYKHFRQSEWFGWVVSIGFKDLNDNVYFTNANNLKIINI